MEYIIDSYDLPNEDDNCYDEYGTLLDCYVEDYED